jgi:hypothetical protein
MGGAVSAQTVVPALLLAFGIAGAAWYLRRPSP